MSLVLTRDLEPGIRLVELNRPETLNSLSAGLMDELQDAMREAGDDRRCRVVILHGAGRGFGTALGRG